MRWGRTSDLSKFLYFSVNEGERTSCLIKIDEPMRVRLQVRSEKPVTVLLVTPDGESTLPLAHGLIVDWNGRVEAGGVEIAADTSFWYLCHKSRILELVDPTPMVIEMEHTEADVLRTMIEDRLRRWQIANEMNRPLTEDEKDELVLDIANGDLEFDEKPDEFGLGYEERLNEYIAKQTEEQAPPEAAPGPAGSVPDSPVTPPAAGSTVPST